MFFFLYLPEKRSFEGNMIILRTSNFQGAAIRPIVPRHKHSLLFSTVPRAISKFTRLQLNYFQLFEIEAVKTKLKKKLKKKTDKTSFVQLQSFILYKPSCVGTNFLGGGLSIQVFSADGHRWADNVSPRINAIASSD